MDINIKELVDTCPVELYQSKNEFTEFLTEIQNMPIKSVLEIGSMFGGTLWTWLNLFKLERLNVVDAMVSSFDQRFVTQANSHNTLWKQWCNDKKCEFTLYEGYSTNTDIINKVTKLPKIDMLFIDGDHNYYTVKSDYMHYKDMVNTDGLIVFHDIGFNEGSNHYGVKPLWNSIKNKYKFKEFIDKDGENGIGVLYV